MYASMSDFCHLLNQLLQPWLYVNTACLAFIRKHVKPVSDSEAHFGLIKQVTD